MADVIKPVSFAISSATDRLNKFRLIILSEIEIFLLKSIEISELLLLFDNLNNLKRKPCGDYLLLPLPGHLIISLSHCLYFQNYPYKNRGVILFY